MKTISSTRAKTPNALSWSATGKEEDDFDVEEDEEHRDQVEADPEAEALRTSEGRPHSYGSPLEAMAAAGRSPS
jgi:hypothetical protein